MTSLACVLKSDQKTLELCDNFKIYRKHISVGSMGYYYLDLFEKLMSQCMNRIEYMLFVTNRCIINFIYLLMNIYIDEYFYAKIINVFSVT